MAAGGPTTMESVIFEFICANQGAVDADELKYNLFPGDSTNQAICNQNKFALCSLNGQQKVLVKTSLKLCRVQNCLGTCGALHLCKNVLYAGSCQRKVCHFSHDLLSDHNQRMLREHEVENLGRMELCTLLLQNDVMLLPSICHDYNNGDGEFGGCQSGLACRRLHICEQYLSHDCSCWKNHDFYAVHPLKTLHDYGMPHALIPSLRSIYVNKGALKSFGNGRDRGRGGHHSANRADANSDVGQKLQPLIYFRGRGRGGNRGSRGSRGGRGGRGNGGNLGSRTQKPDDPSLADILADIDGLNLYTSNGLSQDDRLRLGSSSSDVSVCTSDVASNDGDRVKRRRRHGKSAPGTARGRGSNRGNHNQFKRTASMGDVAAAVTDKTEICMFFVKGYCKNEERCFKAHDKMPYRWQIQEGDQWTNLRRNEKIEEDYCDPQNTYSNNNDPPVHFDTMTCGQNKVRRLSTVNSLVKPDFILTTEWLWYWQDEFGKSSLYASNSGGHKPADIDSAKLEQKFLEDDKDVVEFVAGSQSYSLSFQDMIQTNKQYGTKRVVSRRPRFVSSTDIREKRVRKPQLHPTLPVNWDKTQIPQTGFSAPRELPEKKVTVPRTSNEFKAIEALFCTTMRGFDITTLERIQNKALWEVFQWQKNVMKSNNGGCDVTEKQLFHGTNSKYVDAICLNNFDWRICGVNGTAYGKGSYFARDAKYSHSYTDDSNVKTMFISRVLVGSYTKGDPEYRRPPSKDGGDINFYDSCVNDVPNPSIFVIFEKHQIYPEYLLQYKTTHHIVTIFNGATAPAPQPAPQPAPKPVPNPVPQPVQNPNIVPKPILKPVPAPKPAPAVSQNSTPSSLYRPSTSSNLSSTASYRSNTPAYQPSPSSYLSSTASYRSNMPAYQPSTSTFPSTTATSLTRTSSANIPPLSYSPPPGKPGPKKPNNPCVIS